VISESPKCAAEHAHNIEKTNKNQMFSHNTGQRGFDNEKKPVRDIYVMLRYAT
jgi:hypothetical protein